MHPSGPWSVTYVHWRLPTAPKRWVCLASITDLHSNRVVHGGVVRLWMYGGRVDAAYLRAYQLPSDRLPTVIGALERESAPILREAAAQATAYVCAVLMAAAEEGESDQEVIDWILGPLAGQVGVAEGVTLHHRATGIVHSVHTTLSAHIQRPPIPQVIDTTFAVTVPECASEAGESSWGVLVVASNPEYVTLWEDVSGATPWSMDQAMWARVLAGAEPECGVLSWQRDLRPVSDAEMLMQGRELIDIASRVRALIAAAEHQAGVLSAVTDAEVVAMLGQRALVPADTEDAGLLV